MLLVFPSEKKKFIIIIAALTAIIAVTVWAFILLSKTTFYIGTAVEGVDLSGFTLKDSYPLVEKRLGDKYGNELIRLNFGERSWTVDKESISLTFLTEQALKKAYLIGRTGNVMNRLKDIAGLWFDNVSIDVEAGFDTGKMRKILSDIKKQVDEKEDNAAVTYKNGNISVLKHKDGKNLDIGKNISNISSMISIKQFGNVELLVENIIPDVTYDEVKDINNAVAYFSTVFNSGDKNRTYNIRLACSKIDGRILMPMEIFSMNKALGPRTLENGYKEAPVIYKNELIKGPGGGVCQVTTTLYNSVLKSKLEVIERMHHSMPLGYVEPGRDATIAEGSIDFKFQNNREYPICLSAEATGNTLKIRILGKKESSDSVVKLVSEVVEEYLPEVEDVVLDTSVPEGETQIVREARKGLKVIVYRYTYSSNGELLDREKISEDIYRPVRGIVKMSNKYYNRDKNIEIN